jgi:metal-responsive CopG/Arc/MetJ family transcriptional regulator
MKKPRISAEYKAKSYTVSLPKYLFDTITTLSKKNKCNRSQWMRHALIKAATDQGEAAANARK